jgi:hypothetical protein
VACLGSGRVFVHPSDHIDRMIGDPPRASCDPRRDGRSSRSVGSRP